MHIRLNGAPTALPGPLTVSALVRQLTRSADGAGVAVAVNGEVVRQPEWQGLAVAEGDEVEILQPFAGG